MTDIKSIPTEPRLIPVTKLEKSTLNARRTPWPGGTGELKASIMSHGLMQNLVVTASGDGTYGVIAGGRRLEAIRSLQAERRLPQDFAVPCQIVTEDRAVEMSLAENTVRLAMHPADQFEAFAELIDKGATAAEVAERFGVEESLVHKRMKLARVAPELLAEYRNDGMTLECLMAYAVTDDHHRQNSVFESLPDWQADDPDAIRGALIGDMVEAGSKLARFVGTEAYAAAGGTRMADLFGETVYFENPELLNRLAEAKLEEIRHELASEGWGWIEINPERDWSFIGRCGRIDPVLLDVPADLAELKSGLEAELDDIEQALEENEADSQTDERHREVLDRLEEVEAKMVAFAGFPPDQKALAGCFVSIGQDGAPQIDRGLVKPEHRRQLARLLGTDDDRETEPVRVKDKSALPETLRRSLADARLRIAQFAIATHPPIALDLLVFHAAVSLFEERGFRDGPDVEFKRPRPNMAVMDKQTSDGAFEEAAKLLPLDWLKAGDEAARFGSFRQLPDADRMAILARCVALTLKPKLGSATGRRQTAYDIALSLTAVNVPDHWRPTRDNILNRLTRKQLLSVARDVCGEVWTQSHSADKKPLLVDHLDRLFADPVNSGRTSEQVAKLKGWLPEGMTFGAAHADAGAATVDGVAEAA